MTPLRGFFKRILGASAPEAISPASGPPRARRRAAEPDDPAPPEDEARTGRRRGSRGGRGRGDTAAPTTAAPTASSSSSASTRANGRGRGSNGTNGASGASPEPRAYTWNARTGDPEADEQSRQRREQASRQRRSSRPSFRPYREHLDQPLPEDIAFRSPTEGGDRTILPARRRRGTGLRDTERVIVGGARSLSGWPRPHGEPVTRVAAATAEHLEDDDDDREVAVSDGAAHAEASDDAAPRRRRRGRRGGRGRRRPGAAIAGDTGDALIDDDDADAADETDDHDEEIEEIEDVQAVELPRSIAIAAVLSGEADDEAEAIDDALDDALDDTLDDEPDYDGAGDVRAARPHLDAGLDGHDEDDEHDAAREDDRDAPALVALHDPRDGAHEDIPAPATADEIIDEDEDIAAEPEETPVVPTAPARRARRPRAAAAPAADLDPGALPQAFADLGIGMTTLQTIARWGFTKPSPIQERAIPALLAGKDVVGVAQTGSGKTVAFGVPMVEALDPDLAEVQGLVLVPTRELASQVLDVLSTLAAGYGLEAVGILGGHSLAGDFKALERRPAIVVGTPGRVIDHLQRGTLSLRYVRYAVLDEADQMLDIGFLPDIRRILSRTPKRRQTALFSATMPSTIRRLVWQFMENPETVTVDPELSTVDTIDQVYFEVATRDKARGLRELVDRELKGRTLVFCKMKRAVDRLEADLARQGVRVGALHGDMDQRHRERVVQMFRNGELDILIATNVAARGLDIPEITHVVNYDVPQNPEEYVHRIGRTGRAGREGKAITFVSEWDMREWDIILDAFGEHLRREELAIYSA